MKYVWLLKLNFKGVWRVVGVYSSQAKAQRIASEHVTDVSIRKWPIL